MITRRGIFLHLPDSIYTKQLNKIKFYFSSKFYLNKFNNEYEEHRKRINESLSKRFKYNINVDILADMVLYKKIETRGFYVKKLEGDTWQEITKLDGVIKIMSQLEER